MSRFRNVRRGGRPCPPKGSCEFAESFRKNRIFCGRTESSAPTDSLRFSRFRVGVGAHIDPAERTDFTITFGEFVIAKWVDVGIAPTQIWNPSSEKRTAVLVKQQSVFLFAFLDAEEPSCVFARRLADIFRGKSAQLRDFCRDEGHERRVVAPAAIGLGRHIRAVGFNQNPV